MTDQRGGIGTVAFALVLLAPALGACASLPEEGFAPVEAAPQPRFDALRFFSGRSTGRGELSKILGGTVPVRVTSEGTLATDGTLTLVQRVKEGDKEPRERIWTLRETTAGRYVGSLTDAEGPVTAVSEGNRLTISYIMKDGFKVEQTLTLSRDGQSAYNELRVTMLGATVAVLAEKIVRE